MGGETEENASKQITEWEIYEDSQEVPQTSEKQANDNKEPKFEGFRKSREYWSRLWREGHKDRHGQDMKFKETWESLRKEGKTDVEIFDIITKENPNYWMWSQFMKKMEDSDEESLRGEMRDKFINKIKEHHIQLMTPEQKEAYEKLKAENKENEFWKNYWLELHKEGHPKRRWLGFMPRRRPCGEEGHSGDIQSDQEADQSSLDSPQHWRKFRHWGWGRCGRDRKSDDKSFYKEFDFVNWDYSVLCLTMMQTHGIVWQNVSVTDIKDPRRTV